MINVFVLLVITVFLALYVYFQNAYTYWKKRGVPWAKPTLPFGNFARTLIINNPAYQVNQYYKEFEGERYAGLYTINRPTLLLRDPELIKNVMAKDFAQFYHRGFHTNEEKEPFQGHLFFLSGPKWRHLRVKLTPTFTSGKMKMMFSIVAETGNQLQKFLEKSAANKEVIEFKDILARYTTDVISNIGFGVECNSLNNPKSEFREWGKKVFDPSFRVRVANTLTFIAPLLPKFLNIFLFDPEMSGYFMNMVKETIEYREKNNVHRNDFLQLMIQLKNKTLGEGEADPLLKLPSEQINGLKSSAPFEVTMEVIGAQCFVFFAAGFETSSTTMTFCLYELALNPDIQDRVRAEMDSILAKHNGQITYEAIHEMEYLDKVVSETMRKYPPLPILVRECTETTKLRGTDVIVEKGTQVVLPVMGLQHDPKYFPDPDKFDPERFNEEEKNKRHPFCYLPFGEGPRICIGMRFGLMQTKIGLISILSKYEVQVSDKTPIPLQIEHATFVLSTKGGMFLKIVNRKKESSAK